MRKSLLLLLILLSSVSSLPGQLLQIEQSQDGFSVSVQSEQGASVTMPQEGLWSIATGWEKDWPSNWHHGFATKKQDSGPWQILTGNITLPQGELLLQDAYKEEKGRIKCVRRFEWQGQANLDSVTLSVRWQISSSNVQAFLPGILYYGNPSGEKNGAHKVPVYHGRPGEMALFEEHRYPMPFACLEWLGNNTYHGAALHAIPSPVAGANRSDQWWSLGVESSANHAELILFSGPVAYNGNKSTAKALQRGSLPYGDTYLTMKPGMVIEKSFYLEVFETADRGTAFQRPLYTSIDIFKPFYTEDLPTVQEIIESKYRFAKARWIEGENYAGFNMYPDFERPRIVLGWAGQSEAPTYALQVLADELGDDKVWEYVQMSMDHIITSPISKNGFPVRYEVQQDKWERPDPVSEGQAMNSIALAIKVGRRNQQIQVSQWEDFLIKACDIHAKRLLSEKWDPRNTAEAFYISPLLIASKLFNNEVYRNAAFKAADYYADRHLDMSEPYWGGTLDATCEDKEGAWGAFQGFMACYEYTEDEQYLQWAQHAGDVVLSYTVVWDIPLPAGRMADHYIKTRGWTGVSPQNQHLDVYGVLMTPQIYQLGKLTGRNELMRLAEVMYRSCGQMIDPFGSHGEQLQQTNYTQLGTDFDVMELRGGYSESWTVFWITAHFLHAAATFKEMGVEF